MLSILLFVAAVFLALSVMAAIATVGKPREPITGATAVGAVLIHGGIIALLIIAAVSIA